MKEKMKYKPPKLIRINDELAAGANCFEGSNATDGCWSGYSAGGIECGTGYSNPNDCYAGSGF
jgi:hypothetical protein